MKSKYTILPLALAPFAALATNQAHAQALSIGVYPPVIEVQTTPPSSPSTTITVSNFESLPVQLSIQLIPIRTNRLNNGQIELAPELASKPLYQIVQSRIQVIDNGQKVDSITLDPLEKRDLTLNINTEKGDPPGDFYYALTFISKGIELSQTSTSQIPGGVATNVLLSIGPKTQSTADIEDFSTKSFFESGPVPFHLLVKNTSSHLIAPVGKITITNMLGKEVGSSEVLSQYILADSKRYLVDKDSINHETSKTNNAPTVIWPEKFLLGAYTAKVTLKLDDTGVTVTKSISFFAFPTYLYFIIFAVLFIGISIYIRVKKRLR